jgi:hypothetical protein
MLNYALSANALFSLCSGISMLVWRDELTLHFPGPGWVWILLGVGLISFCAQLLLMVKYPTLARKLTPEVIVADIGWVLISLAIWLFLQESISSVGTTLIMLINVIVATLAWLQFQGYRSTRYPTMSCANAAIVNTRKL